MKPKHNFLRLWGKGITFATIGICAALIGLLQAPQLEQLQAGSESLLEQELNQDVETERLRLEFLEKLPALGFENLIADWTFLGFLQYFGDDPVRAKTGYALSPDYFEVIIGKDPYYRPFYLFLSGSTTLYAGLPDRTVNLMEEGLEHLSPTVPPDSYYVWRYKGTDELLFLGNAQLAREAFEMAATWASIHSDPESQSIAEISRQTAQFLEDNPGSKAAQVSAWAAILQNAFDKRTQALAIQRIQELGGQITPDGRIVVQPD